MDSERLRYFTVFDIKSNNSMPDGPLPDFLEWLSEQVAKVPPEWRSRAEISFSADSEYDCPYPTMSLIYNRPATPEEIAAEDARFELERINRVASTVRNELETLARLKAKYEGKP